MNEVNQSETKIVEIYREQRETSITTKLNTYIPSSLIHLIISYDYYFEGNLYYTLSEHQDNINSVLINGETIISGSNDGKIKGWSTKTLRCISTIDNFSPINCLVKIDSNTIVSGSNDRTIQIYDILTEECRFILKGDNLSVFYLDVFPDGTIVSGTEDNQIMIWSDWLNIKDSDETITLNKPNLKFPGVIAGKHSILILDNDHIAYSNESNQLIVLNRNTGMAIHTFLGHTELIRNIRRLLNGRIVTSSADFTIRIWNFETNKSDHVLMGHEGEISDLIIHPDGRIISGSIDTSIRIWSSITGICEHILKAQEISCLNILPDGRIISGYYGGVLRIWNQYTGVCETVIPSNANIISSINILLDGRVVTSSYEDFLIVWDE